jgi:hypothetical protein
MYGRPQVDRVLGHSIVGDRQTLAQARVLADPRRALHFRLERRVPREIWMTIRQRRYLSHFEGQGNLEYMYS